MKILFIHGLGQTSESWNRTLKYLPSDIETECPDITMFVKDKAVIYDNLYKGFKTYCCNTGEPLILCGISLGAVLALNYAIDHPDKVKSMILIAPQYKVPRAIIKLQNLIFKIMPDEAFSKLGFSKKNILALTNSMGNLDFSGELKRIKSRTLILCGENDNTNKKAGRELAEKLADTKFKLVKRSGHEVNNEEPEVLAYLIKKFLKL